MRAGKLPSSKVSTGNSSGQSTFFNNLGSDMLTWFVDFTESISLIAGVSPTYATVTLSQTQYSRFKTTGDKASNHGNLTVRASTKTVTSVKPIAKVAAVAIGIVDINQTLQFNGHFDLTGEFDLRSNVDATNNTIAKVEGSIAIAVSTTKIVNSVVVNAVDGSHVRGTMRVQGATIERMQTSASATQKETRQQRLRSASRWAQRYRCACNFWRNRRVNC